MALDLNETTDQIAMAASPTLNSLSAMTALRWIWFDSFDANAGIGGKGAGATRKAFTIIGAATGFSFQARTTVGVGTAVAPFSSMPMPGGATTGRWLCLGAAYDLSMTNGVFIYGGDDVTPATEATYSFQSLTPGTVADDSASPWLEGPVDGAASFNGRVATLAVWNRLITLPEFRSQQYQFDPVVTSGLVDFIQFEPVDLGGTGTQTDRSGNGNHGTPSGTTFVSHPAVFSRSVTTGLGAVSVTGAVPSRSRGTVLQPATPRDP